MTYLLYLKRSLRRRPARYIQLFIIMTCAIILPMVVSVYRDSNIYGNNLYVYEQTKGQSFHLKNAKEAYLDYFSNIDGLNAYYEDNTIYLKIIADSESEERELARSYEYKIMTIMDGLNDSSLELAGFTAFGTDESIAKFPRQLLLVFMAMVLISVLIIESTYKAHLRRLTPEIACLRSLGATCGKILIMVLIEFSVLFLLSGIVATLITSSIMRFLFDRYLETRDVQNLSWVVYKMYPSSLMLQFALSFFPLSAIVLIILRSINKTQIARSLLAAETGDRAKHYKAEIAGYNNRSASSSLARMFIKRSNGHFRSSRIIVIPILTVFLFMFNYLMVNIEEISKPPEYEITIQMSQRPGSADNSDKWYEALYGISGIGSVVPTYNMSPMKYLAKDDRADGYSGYLVNDAIYATTYITRYSDHSFAQNGSNAALKKFDVAVSKNHAHLKYSVGDVIRLYEFDIIRPMSDPENAPCITLTVAKELDLEWTDRMLQILVSDELFEELVKDETVNRVRIHLADTGLSKSIENELRAMYPSPMYTVINDYESYLFIRESTTGLWLMLLYLFGIMFFFVVIILNARTRLYIDSQSSTIRTMYVLGASKKCITSAYMKQAAIMAGRSIAIICIIAYGLLFAFFNNTGYYLVANVTTVTVQVCAIIIIACAYTYPVYSAVQGKLTRIYK